jgi:septum formation protein
METETPPLILASASPRRQELATLFGLPLEIIPSRYEEPKEPIEPILLREFVQTLALGKAREVAGRVERGIVLGADTTVTLSLEARGVPLGKPADRAEAHRMLRLLSGRVHVVYTGVALIRVAGTGVLSEPLCESVATRVRFREMSDAMIANYLDTGEPFDKAGAYGAQGYAAPFIEGFEGDFFNVVGLPVCTVGRLLEQMGVLWWRFPRQ